MNDLPSELFLSPTKPRRDPALRLRSLLLDALIKFVNLRIHIAGRIMADLFQPVDTFLCIVGGRLLYAFCLVARVIGLYVQQLAGVLYIRSEIQDGNEILTASSTFAPALIPASSPAS